MAQEKNSIYDHPIFWLPTCSDNDQSCKDAKERWIKENQRKPIEEKPFDIREEQDNKVIDSDFDFDFSLKTQKTIQDKNSLKIKEENKSIKNDKLKDSLQNNSNNDTIKSNENIQIKEENKSKDFDPSLIINNSESDFENNNINRINDSSEKIKDNEKIINKNNKQKIKQDNSKITKEKVKIKQNEFDDIKNKKIKNKNIMIEKRSTGLNHSFGQKNLSMPAFSGSLSKNKWSLLSNLSPNKPFKYRLYNETFMGTGILPKSKTSSLSSLVTWQTDWLSLGIAYETSSWLDLKTNTGKQTDTMFFDTCLMLSFEFTYWSLQPCYRQGQGHGSYLQRNYLNQLIGQKIDRKVDRSYFRYQFVVPGLTKYSAFEGTIGFSNDVFIYGHYFQLFWRTPYHLSLGFEQHSNQRTIFSIGTNFGFFSDEISKIPEGPKAPWLRDSFIKEKDSDFIDLSVDDF